MVAVVENIINTIGDVSKVARLFSRYIAHLEIYVIFDVDLIQINQ